MSDVTEPRNVCQHCERVTPYLFQVAHPQTTVHWRCVRCLRDLVNEEGPETGFALITGVTTRTAGKRRLDHPKVKRAAVAAGAVLAGKGAP